MCSPQHADLIQEVADELVNDDKAFTAFEVSLEVQKRAKKNGLPHERHREMKNTTHRTLQQFVDNGVYEQTLADVGAPTRAFLYHPPGFDVSSYVPLERRDKPQTQPPQTAASSAGNSSAGTSSPGLSTTGVTAVVFDDSDEGDEQDTSGTHAAGGKTGDARGTVAVSAQVLRSAGFNKDDVVYACASTKDGSKVLVLTKQVLAGLSKQTSYTVDHGNNIRITEFTLKKAGLDTSNGYDFERDGDQVVVKAHD